MQCRGVRFPRVAPSPSRFKLWSMHAGSGIRLPPSAGRRGAPRRPTNLRARPKQHGGGGAVHQAARRGGGGPAGEARVHGQANHTRAGKEGNNNHVSNRVSGVKTQHF